MEWLHNMAGTYEPIATSTLGSAGTFTFNSIPATYTDLIIIGRDFLSPSGTPGVSLRFNNDSASNYSANTMEYRAQNSTNLGATVSNATYINSGSNVGFSSTSNQFGVIIINIFQYSNSSVFKNVNFKYGQLEGSYPGIVIGSGIWKNTNAINSINITAQTGNFQSGASFTVYGIKAA